MPANPEKDVATRYKALFEERRLYLESFQERRREYDEMLAAHREKRKAMEEALSAELGAGRAKLAAVAPLGADETNGVPLRRAAYSDRMAAVMAKLALLAYVAFEDAERKEVLETALGQAEIKLIGAAAVGNTEVFVCESAQFVAVSFRGTTNKQDARTNFSFGVRKVSVPGYGAEVEAHEGFYEAFGLVEQRVRRALEHVDPNKPIFLTGHSLGGALALVASAALAGRDDLGARIAAVYTFGAPRVGAASFARVVKAPHYRIVNSGDVVPLAPPNWLLGYRHSGELILLQRGKVTPQRNQSPLGTALLVLWGALRWMFTGRLLFERRHSVALYASRLEVIAQQRGGWS